MTESTVYRGDIVKRGRVFNAWERYRATSRVHWAAEMFAEALGVFFYVYAGVSSTAGFVLGNILKEPTVTLLTALEQIGFAYSFGILFAICCAGATSGGHFNPCITIARMIFHKFPPLKGVRYIIAQILGAYIASALIYNQWKYLIDAGEEALVAAGAFGTTMFTPTGPAGIFALYLPPGQSLSRAFLNECTNSFFVALVIWACSDPSNVLVPPQLGPVVIAFSYGVAVWGFAIPGIALNTARDVGCRLWTMSIWGMPASGGKYAAIAALTNIPMTLLAFVVYEFILADSDRVVTSAHLEFENAIHNHRRVRRERHNTRSQSLGNPASHEKNNGSNSSKASVHMYEVAQPAVVYNERDVHEVSRV
ncbi:putative aquaporin 2 [Cyathus striatus]|nr:putative aquaporin 2 [Cyathus striatus]